MVKTISKRLIVVLLLLSMLLGVLVGCKKDEDEPDEGVVTTADDGDSDRLILDELPEKDFGGKKFKLLTLSGYNAHNCFVNKEYTGEPIEEVSYERTVFVEEKYNVTLEVIEDTKENSFASLVRENQMSGMNAYDLLYPHPTTGIVPLMEEGYFANLYGLENLELTNKWYNQQQVSNYLAGDKLYIVTSDYSIVGQGTVALVYNKEMYADQNFNYDVYEAVENGTWTIESLKTLIQNFSVEDDGTGTYGLQFHEGYTDRFLYAFGEMLSTKDANNNFAIGYNTTRLSDIAGKLYSLVNEHPGVYHEMKYDSQIADSTMFTNFKTQKSLFITFDVGSLHQHLRSLEFKIGILPLPKLDETQTDYYSVCAAGFFAIPSTVDGEIEDSALILDALSRYSYVYMRPKFFETVLLGRMSDSEKDYKILEKIHNDKVYEFAFTADNDEILSKMLYKVVVVNKSTNVNGYLRGNSPYIKTLFERMNAIS